MRNRVSLYQCWICDNRPYEPLSWAIKHESSAMHTNRIRHIDRPAPLSSPPLMDDIPLPPGENTYATELEISGDMTEGSREGCNDPMFIPEHLSGSREYAYATIQGPALPEDPQDQIYDDWGGELAYLGEEAFQLDADVNVQTVQVEGTGEAANTVAAGKLTAFRVLPEDPVGYKSDEESEAVRSPSPCGSDDEIWEDLVGEATEGIDLLVGAETGIMLDGKSRLSKQE